MVGYWLARRWGLPAVHRAVIRDHHRPTETGPYCGAVGLVHLADRLIKDLDIGLVQESRPVDPSPAMNATGLTAAEMEAVAREIPMFSG